MSVLSVAVTDRPRARFWMLSEEERGRAVVMFDCDERFRSAKEEAETTGRDLVLVEIERGLLEPAELATIVTISDLQNRSDTR